MLITASLNACGALPAAEDASASVPREMASEEVTTLHNTEDSTENAIYEKTGAVIDALNGNDAALEVENEIPAEPIEPEIVEAPPVEEAPQEAPEVSVPAEPVYIALSDDLPYAGYSMIHSGEAKLYYAQANRKNFTVCINAGHGTQGGSSVKTQCHPDGTPKVTGGTTSAGSTTAVAVSSGMTFEDGTPEYLVTLAEAIRCRDKLLADGFDVLMIRDTEDVQLDNVARTVLANNYANCHIAIHWDSTTSDKGAFYMSTPDVDSFKSMEPVASTWPQSENLGSCLIQGLSSVGVKIFEGGALPMDLTQTSYS
ncbi:MAG: N-acetylmuramoyl-L-alanine amidase, partial [Lachnospiraceae bacterium]|nr:N-acetylmuramoyl-L-alanine amidase [Candidatus Equihabitans merdae]